MARIINTLSLISLPTKNDWEMFLVIISMTKCRERFLKYGEKGVISVPYVNIHGDVPDGGFPAFVDSPRYATGYTTLFNSIGTVVETHMLKPYKDRVKVTYDYMVDNLNYIGENYKTIQQKRAENLKQYKVGKPIYSGLKLDSTKYETIDFKGF